MIVMQVLKHKGNKRKINTKLQKGTSRKVTEQVEK